MGLTDGYNSYSSVILFYRSCINMINLYTIDCPKCIVLEKKLDEAGIEYNKITDMNIILEVSKKCGFKSAPILEVDDKYYKFNDAVEYIRNL